MIWLENVKKMIPHQCDRAHGCQTHFFICLQQELWCLGCMATLHSCVAVWLELPQLLQHQEQVQGCTHPKAD